MVEQADYHIVAQPLNNKTWREADDIEVSCTLKLEGEERIFKGNATLMGIIKK